MKEDVKMEAGVREERRVYTAGVEDGGWGLKIAGGLWTLEKEGKPISTRASRKNAARWTYHQELDKWKLGAT